uniref:WGS project CAEQ00000000 data, annotated contig 1059 n=1 Tax=Trypanosoma congolense (strain IL3000) TaxID=1068625 RepID=F9W3J2_TRYCI|nr:unnamed protein product [Trypanosoma congolense IL3000]
MRTSSNVDVCTLLSHSRRSADILREGFDKFPHGMTLEEFRSFASENVFRRRDSGEATPGGSCNYSQKNAQYSTWGGVYSQRLYPSSPQPSARSATLPKVNFSPFKRCRRLAKTVLGCSSPHEEVDSDQYEYLDYLFGLIDCDRDGVITWEDVLQRGVDEATQDIKIARQSVCSYSLHRSSSSLRAIKSVHGLPKHKSLFAVVTGSAPLTLLKKSDFSVVKKFTRDEMDSVIPTMVEYLPASDILLSYSRDNATIRGWWNFLSPNQIGTLNPFYVSGIIRRLRTGSSALPYSFFTAGSNGDIQHWKVPKQRYISDVTLDHTYKGLHSSDSGGVIDFVSVDGWFFSAGFDHRIVSTDLETGRSAALCKVAQTIRIVEHNESLNCFPCVTCGNELLLWDVRSSAEACSTPLMDDSFKMHRGSIIGMCNVPSLPQVVTCDNTGRMKVWDLRLLRCVQTMYSDGSSDSEPNLNTVDEDAAEGKCGSFASFRDCKGGKYRYVTSLCCFGGTEELITCSAEGIVSLRYDRRRDCNIADVDLVRSAHFDEQHELIILQGPTRTTVWDARCGYRRSLFDRVSQSDIPIGKHEVIAMCIDPLRSRFFYALVEGVVEVRSSKDYVLLDTYSMHNAEIVEMRFSYKHNMLVTMAENGMITIRNEKRSVPSTTSIVVSDKPLRALILSDELGLVCCCDDNYIYFIDYRQTTITPFPVEAPFSVHVMAVFGALPVLALASKEGEIMLWSLPPAEVSYMILAVIRIEGFPSPDHGMPALPSDKSHENTDHQHFNAHLAPVGSTGMKDTCHSEDALTVASSSLRKPKGECGDCSLSSLLRDGSDADTKDSVVSAMVMDDVLHNLFVADGTGKILIYSLCPVVQDYGLVPCSFEKRTKCRLREVSKESRNLETPPLLCTIKAHQSRPNFMEWFSGLRVLITGGSESDVKLFDVSGNELGQLLMMRLPPPPMFDAVAGGLQDNRGKSVSSASREPPYSLPQDIKTTRKCDSCALVEERRQDSIPPSAGDDPSPMENIFLSSEGKKQSDKTTPRHQRRNVPIKFVKFMRGAAGHHEDKSGDTIGNDDHTQVVSAEASWLDALRKKRKCKQTTERSQGSYIHNSDLINHPSKIVVTTLPELKPDITEAIAMRALRNRVSGDLQLEQRIRPLGCRDPFTRKNVTVLREVDNEPETDPGNIALNTLSLNGVTLPTGNPTIIQPYQSISPQRRRDQHRIHPKRNKEKWEFFTSGSINAPQPVREDDVSNALDQIVLRYEKEMHRCFRGDKGRAKKHFL